AGQVAVLKGGERLELAGTGIKVAYTPGHAKHHISFLDEHSGVAYVGDTAGVRVGSDYLIEPTPPPDIDIDAWQPVSLFITHFGPITPARAHLARFRTVVSTAAETARQMIDAGGTGEELLKRFTERMRQDARKVLPEHEARTAELAAPFDQL